ncbi:hypothetical protein F8G81_05935 [Arthrobacter sp. CDRTa11]|uniref:hypothetical protein n=1 Tax=Arthrobacter sp. CDRTa11 TaxID=2651199 RepID=UPI002265A39C|nr:hypothetical protein [Arthrobacter sp. CDRTa11]UZX02206.1 hypothetical protein F8G81_05935 [Arthrobacter sp. CDRTa11]
MDYTKVTTPLSIAYSLFESPLSFRYGSFSTIDFLACNISGARLDFAKISGSLGFFGSHMSGETRLSSAEIRGRVVLAKATLDGAGGRALNLDAARVTGDVLMDNLTAKGEVRAQNAQLAGRLVLENASLKNNFECAALDLDGAQVAGDVFCRNLSSEGEIRAVGANFGSQFHATGSTFKNLEGPALNLDNASLAGSFVVERVRSRGELRAAGAQLGGQIRLSGAKISADNSPAVNFDGADIGGEVFLDDAASIKGEVRFHSAHFRKQISLAGASLVASEYGSEPIGLNMSWATVEGSVFLTDGFNLDGQMKAFGCDIRGQLNFAGASINNPKKVAVDLDFANISGSVLCNDGFAIDGMMRAHRVRIGGLLSFVDAKIRNPDGVALRVTNSKIDSLHLANEAFEGRTNLAYAQIGTLVTTQDRPVNKPYLPNLLSAQGLELGAFHGFIKEDRDAAASWLDSIPRGSKKEFIAQPWRALATVFDSMGQSSEARWLRYQAAIRTTRSSHWRSKPFHWLYRWLVGYGYRPLRPFIWLGAILVLSFTLAVWHANDFTPTNREVAKITVLDGSGNPTPLNGSTNPHVPGYPSFSPYLFAIDTALPAVDTGQAKSWQITNSVLLPMAFAGIKGLSWLLGALLLAGLTGILKKE